MLGPLLILIALAGWAYSAYLLWVGLPKLMTAPADKKVGYFITVLVVGLLAGLVLNMATSAVHRLAAPSTMPGMPM
jgi:hypothetical protein